MAAGYTKKYFKFNLIPPKSKEEINVLVERDNTLFYSFLLIFFGMLLFFILSVIKVLAVDPSLAALERNIANVNTQISNYSEIRRINGELYIKSQALDPILDKDVEVTKVLELESKIRTEFPNLIEVVDYSRRGDGSFSFSFNISSAARVKDIIDYLTTQPDVNNIFLENVFWENTQSAPALVNISFFLSNINNG